ncbi:RNA polymerase sigma factor SigF [Streptomyces albiaxialis]|uniref:RNA polymerase sigma factor SigF n=1 Tax=Streptomyces albiaxialis TaxID=329523 RepID=A0ABP5IJQ7_9ACTN
MTCTSQPPLSGRRPHPDTPDTSAEFAELARLGDGPAKRTLQDEVVAAWLPLAHRLARRFRNRGESLEDLEQVAALALVKSVERYDPEQGTGFLSFALPTIRGELKRHFRDYMWEVHVPRRVQNLRNRVRNSIRELEAATSRPPTVREVAEHSGLPEDDVRAGMEALHSFTSLSLDASAATGDEPGGREGQLTEILGEEDPGYDTAVDREAARTYLSCLPEREQRILYLRFFQGLYQHEIAEILGISQMHVSRLITGACRQVREAVDNDEPATR